MLGKLAILWAKKNIFAPSIKTLASNLLTILGSGFRKGHAAVFCLFLLMTSGNVFGQITFDSKEELIKAANSFFEKGEYSKAKPLFSQLLSQDAMNPNYNYRFGVCILFTEDDPVKPMPYIEGGAGSPGVNDEAFYFLGKLYQFNYRFDEAIEAFSKAKGKNVQLPNVNIDSNLQACRNGKLLYNPSFEFKPASSKGAIEKEFFRPYDFRKLKGKVIPMPPQFKTKYDEKNLIGSFIFTPLVGQVLFYASYGEDGSNGKDIYRVRKLPNGEWALPMRLPDIINSKLDEDHAFYDTQNDVLYFSSQGHNSMGGLDIFQSAYDAEKDSWSEPVNLQYPYSSPYDDYLYVTDPSLSVAYFTSTRDSEEGRVKVYRVQLPSEEGDPVSIITGQYLETADSSQTRMKAQLRANNELVGEYRTNPGTGKYVIVAEPGQGYQLSIAPRDQEAFDFDLNLPKHFKFKPLEQQSLLNTADGQYKLELTNYFNNKGKEDTIVSVQSKTSGELPGLVASVANTEAEKSDGAIVDAAEKGREEARQEIAELERQVKEKARQDSIAKAESELAAAEELRKAAEAEELAKQKEQARLDSIAKVERVAQEAELKRQQEEAARLAQEQSEKARQDSIAQAAALAAEEARKAAEAEELAKQKEQARLDSIAEVERLAKEAELKRQQEEATRLAQAQAEKARQDGIAQATAQAAEEARKAAEAEELAKQKEQARLDSIAEVERLAKEAELKRQQEEATRLAQAQAEKARQDGIAQATAQAAEEARKAAEAEELAKQKEQARLDSIAEVERLAKEAELKRQEEEVARLAQEQAEKARQDGIAQATAQAAEEARKAAEAEELAKQKEQARLDSIAEVERLAKEAELKRQEEEVARLAQEQAEKASRDSIAQAEALAAEEARKIVEAEELAKQKEQARLDSLAEVERLAQEAELKRQQEEAARLAQKQAEKARQDSIAQAELIALEEARLDSINKEVEAMKAAAIREAEIASSSEESEELLQQLAEEQAKEESTANAAELASAKSQVAKESGSTSADELDKALGQMQAENEIVQSSEVADAEAMAQEIEGTSELDSLNAELANLMIKLSDEGVKRPEKAEEVIALSNEIAELEQIEADKKAERVLAALDERMETAKQMESARQQEKEGLLNAADVGGEEVLSLEDAIADAEKAKEVQVLAEKARQDSIAQAEALAAEEARLAAEAEKLALEQAEKARQDSIAQAEMAAAEQARLEAEAQELAKKQEQARLDSLAEVERLAKETELKRQQEEADRLTKAQAVQDSIAKAEAIAAEEVRKAAEAEELAKQKEQARLDSIAEVEQLAKEAELKRQQEEAELLVQEQAEKARQDSITQAALVATETQSSEVELSDADAFMKAIEEAEKLKEQTEESVSVEATDKKPEEAEASPVESIETPSGDPFIDEVLGAGAEEEVAQEVSEVIEETEMEKPELDDKAMADSLARELEMEMARAEADAMEQALKEAEVVQEVTSEEVEKVEVNADPDTTVKAEEPVAILEEDVNDDEVLSLVRTQLESQLKDVVPEPIEVEEVASEDVAENVESADSIAEVVEEVAIELADSASIESSPEAEALEIASLEKARLDSIARVEAEVAAAEELMKQQEAEEKAKKEAELARIKAEQEARKAKEAAALAAKEAKQAKLDSLAKAEELATAEKEMEGQVVAESIESELVETEPAEKVEEVEAIAHTNESVVEESLSDADAFMKAIEEAEKTRKETAEEAKVDVVKAEQGVVNEESTEVADTEAPAESDLTPDQLLLQKHRELAAQKEKELQEKMNADRAALGLKVEEVEEEQAQEPEIAEVTEITTESLETPKASKSETEELEPSQESDQSEPVNEELAEVDSVEPEEVAATEEVEEPVTEPASTEGENKPETQSETAGTAIEATDDVALSIEKAIAEGASRLFFITPAMRDYSARKTDLSKIEDKTKKRLIQRMLAEDRGRLGVLKNIHNSRLDNSLDKQALAKLEANTRNREVLSGLALANQLAEASSESAAKINWFDRNERMGITYRLMFQFKPSQVSEYVLDAVAASGQPDVEIDGTDLRTGYHTKLAEARAEFLEFRSRGYSNMEIQAFDNGSPVKLMEALNRAVVEK